jgi:hypothetical protein
MPNNTHRRSKLLKIVLLISITLNILVLPQVYRLWTNLGVRDWKLKECEKRVVDLTHH